MIELRTKWRIAAACLWCFGCGFSDAAPGALLPYIEDFYNISYSIVSLIWMANAAGFIVVAAFAGKIQKWFGLRKSLLIGCISSCIMYGMVSSGAHFAVIVAGFFMGGIGLGICLSQCNVYLSRLDGGSIYLAYLHTTFGVGATVSPLIGTAMVNSGVKWHYFYTILLGIIIANGANLWFAFEGENFAETNSSDPKDSEAVVPEELEGQVTSKNASSGEMLEAMKNRSTWLMSLISLFYQGAEVAFAGWIVTYLMDYKKGSTNAIGYVASGFWGGLTLGRLFLTPLLFKYCGIRMSFYITGVLAIVMVVAVWVTPNIIASGVFVAIAGVLAGPNYTLMFAITPRMFPRKIQMISVTFMTALGSIGGAIFPFVVGLISQYSGTYVVLPVFVSLYSVMVILWLALPNVEKDFKAGTPWWKRIL
ncbi:hypothetical protein CAAN1_04S07844 [[Candida] anglica]|uniref:Major facilitator superfamily (MFS) profile domain-containing protein n=1 Tax=[Candida] anglica TaxID=148631 RepID=A0ABP0E8B0_9ASCO